MRRISIEEVRKSLVCQITQMLSSRDFECIFDDDKCPNVFLKTGQQFPCTSVRDNDGHLVLAIEMKGVADIDVTENDVTVESLQSVLTAIIPTCHTMEIWAANCDDEHGDSHTLLYFSGVEKIPTSDEEAINILVDVIPCDWRFFSDNGSEYVFYPNPLCKDRYLVANFY